MITVTATEMQNNFGKYLDILMNGQEIIVKKRKGSRPFHTKRIGRFILNGFS